MPGLGVAPPPATRSLPAPCLSPGRQAPDVVQGGRPGAAGQRRRKEADAPDRRLEVGVLQAAAPVAVERQLSPAPGERRDDPREQDGGHRQRTGGAVGLLGEPHRGRVAGKNDSVAPVAAVSPLAGLVLVVLVVLLRVVLLVFLRVLLVVFFGIVVVLIAVVAFVAGLGALFRFLRNLLLIPSRGRAGFGFGLGRQLLDASRAAVHTSSGAGAVLLEANRAEHHSRFSSPGARRQPARRRRGGAIRPGRRARGAGTARAPRRPGL